MTKEQKKITSPDMPEQELRDLIAWRIANERQKKYPGRGGAKQCAEDIKIIYQQWSQYENGARKPKLNKLREIAKFFGVSLEYFTTPPKDWEQKRHERKTRVKPGRQSRHHFESMMDEQARSYDEPVNTAGTTITANALRTHSPILGIIGKLLHVEKMHEQGKISTPVYKQTLEAIERFTDIANAHKAEI